MLKIKKFKLRNKFKMSENSCLLCFSSVPPLEKIHLFDYSETNMISAADLIKLNFSFFEAILTEEVLKNSSTHLCRECWNKMEMWMEFCRTVESNYQIEMMKEENLDVSAADIIEYDDDEEKIIDTEMIKVEMLSANENFDETTEWIEEEEKKVVSPKRMKRVTEVDLKISRQTTVDSADDQRIKETARMYCDICQESLESLRDAKSHFKAIHGAEGYLVCCNRRFKQRCRLVEHVNTHYNMSSYSCPVCAKTFDSKSYLGKHLATHDSNKQFQCAHCPKSFSRKFQVRNHLLSVHIFDNVLPTFQCSVPFCEKKFVNEARLKHHLSYTHSSTHLEICEVCSKTFKTKSAIEEHQKTHTRRVEDRIRCEICGHFLADLKSYNRHVKNHGTESLENICKYCGKKSPNLNALKKHIRYVHEMSKTYNCRFCDKSFKRPRNLIDHEAALHTLQDLYACSFCPRTFRNQSNMLAHRKKQHPDQYKKPAYMREDL